MKTQYTVLDKIEKPEDLKKLSRQSLETLARELREYIIQVVSKNGGHLASNLGVVELTIALHKVFNSPEDKLIWDVGHQCYPHKILTGRREAFKTIRQLDGLSGFPKRAESKHDIFDTGHSSTSISAGLGVLLGQQQLNIPGKVIAVIGDGSLTGGMALEALNHTGHEGKELVVILNDNEMSISKNVGALSSYLSRLTATHTYQTLQKNFDRALKKIPFLGKTLFKIYYRLKKGIKAVVFRENLFSDFGMEYIGPIDGHNLTLLSNVLRKVKNMHKPVVVHVVTRKGKGYKPAEGNPSRFHGVGGFSVVDGKMEKKKALTFTDAFSEALIKEAEKDQRIVAITAAMTGGTGLSFFKEQFPRRFYDVGITEQHATTFAAGLAVGGVKPVVAIYSTFMQRAVDQVIHDVALPELPVVICMDRAGIVGNDGETHQGVFDISIFRNVPNITFLSPANKNEMEMMLSYGLEKNGPVLMRYPRGLCALERPELSEPIVEGRGSLCNNGGDILIMAVGTILNEVYEGAALLEKEGIKADVYNLRFIKPLDINYLLSLITGYKGVVIVEDGSRTGGIGEKIQTLMFTENLRIPCRALGIPDKFIIHGTQKELLRKCGIDSVSIAGEVKKIKAQASDNITNLKLV